MKSVFLAMLIPSLLLAQDWTGTTELSIRNPIDGQYEPALYYPASKPNRPLVVSLHSWLRRYDHGVNHAPYQWAKQYDWNFLATNHRGPHDRREAGGSKLALVDISEAIKEAKRINPVSQVAFVGCSGGGFTALNYLRVKALEPVDLIVSMNAPIDLTRWPSEYPLIAENVAAMCQTRVCLKQRSPNFSLRDKAFPARIYIFGGLLDSVVHYSHAISIFEVLAEAGNQVFLRIGEHGHGCDVQAMHESLLGELK